MFATRYPRPLRTIILDSAYPAVGQDRYFQTEIKNGPVAFALVCARSPSCDVAQDKARFITLLNALRTKPVTGKAPGANGEMQMVTADPGTLFTVVANAGNSFRPYRDIDAAARAYLDSGYMTPLLRLVAEPAGHDASAGPARNSPKDWKPPSSALITCSSIICRTNRRRCDRPLRGRIGQCGRRFAGRRFTVAQTKTGNRLTLVA